MKKLSEIFRQQNEIFETVVINKFIIYLSKSDSDKIEVSRKDIERIIKFYTDTNKILINSLDLIDNIKLDYKQLKESADKLDETFEAYISLLASETKYDVFKFICVFNQVKSITEHNDNLTNNDICKQFNFSTSYVSAILKDLEEHKLILRIPVNGALNNIPSDLGWDIYNDVGNAIIKNHKNN